MRTKRYKKLITLILVVVFLTVFCYWQNNGIEVTDYVYKTKKIGSSLDGFRIAHISDLHNKEFGKSNKRLLEILRKQKPNIIVITGDLVDRRRTDIAAALRFIKGASELAPIYYVTGNHEYALKQQELAELMLGMEEYHVRISDNKIYHLEQEKEGGFYLIGLCELNLSDGTLTKLCSNVSKDKLQILLAHEPQYIRNYEQSGVDLVLAGHTHGGQFRLPFLGGLVAPDQGMLPKYTSGAHSFHNTTIIISRGLGNSTVPLRLFNRPELVMVTLKKE